VDQIGNLWSLKVVYTFKACIGNFYSANYSLLNQVINNVKTYMKWVDADYAEYVCQQKTVWPDMLLPTCQNPERLYFDQGSPWESKILKTNEGDIEFDYITLLTGIQRNVWLSLGLSAIHRLRPNLRFEGTVEMLMCLMWQNSFEKFYHICKRMNVDIADDSKHPIYEFQAVSRKLFYIKDKEHSQHMFGGMEPRFNCGSVDLEQHFGTKCTPLRECLHRVIMRLCRLLKDLNDVVVDETIQITPELILDDIIEPCHSDLIEEGGQFGPFRLMMFVQAAGYLGFGIKTNSRFREIFFPIPDTGSYTHLGTGNSSVHSNT